MPEVDWVHWGTRLVWDVALPLVAIAATAYALRAAFQQLMKLRVSGNPNEWVLILNNGKLKHAGVGLSGFCGPFDQVATFPSKVNRVIFQTE